jgi:hypothetical protein
MDELDQGATPEVEETEESMDDTIRGILESSVEDTPDDKPEPEVAEKEEQAPETAQALAAPNTWKKAAAEKFNTLPPEVQQEVLRRESDIHKGIEQYREAANFGHSIHEAIKPHLDTINKLGITPDKAIAGLMEADRILRYGDPTQKTQYFAQLAQNYGIDLGQFANGEAPQVDQNIQFLMNKVKEQEQFIQSITNREKQQFETSLNSEIEKFAADPNHSHFGKVAGHMSALLQANQAKDLSDAYEQAVYANPETRALVIAEQQQKQREELAKKAQKAKQAGSVNIKTRPSLPSKTPIGTVDETIRETLENILGR